MCRSCLVALVSEDATDSQLIALQAKATDDAETACRDHRVMAILFTLVYVGDMHLHRGAAQRTDAVEQCNTRVGISTGVEYDAVVVEAYLLHLVDELAFYIALEIVNLHVGEQCFQCGQIALKRVLAVSIL